MESEVINKLSRKRKANYESTKQPTIKYALDEEGNLVTADDVKTRIVGALLRCVDPECKTPIVLKAADSEHMRCHLAHQINSSNSGDAAIPRNLTLCGSKGTSKGETHEHYAAK
jgi:hypothetical protein